MAHVQYTVAYVYYSNVFCNCTPVESSFCRAWSPQASITPLTSFCHSASQVHLCTHSLRENLPKPVAFVCHLKVSYALFERIGFEGRERHKNPFCFQKSLPSPWLFCNRAMLGAWAEKCFLQRGLRSHWCFLFLWVKPGGLGWVSKVSADVRCPRGKRGLHVGHWGGDRRTVDVAGHWGRVGGGHLRLEGAGCRGVSGCDGRGGVGGVHRWGVAGVHWGREGGDRRGVMKWWEKDSWTLARKLRCIRLQLSSALQWCLSPPSCPSAAGESWYGACARRSGRTCGRRSRRRRASRPCECGCGSLGGRCGWSCACRSCTGRASGRCGCECGASAHLSARSDGHRSQQGMRRGARGRCLAWPVGVLAHATGLDELRLVDAL